jgi:hypothetical protein
MVYYQQQSVARLAQISNQLFSMAPQVSIPPTPISAQTDLMSRFLVHAPMIVFSHSAALLATLVQQWVWDYMRVLE